MKSRIQTISICITALATTAVLLGATSTGSSATAADSPPTRPISNATTVQIDNFNFKPRDLAVKVGETVTWVNHDDVPHTATVKGKSPEFDSKLLDTDEQFSFTFKKPGTYAYYCKVHPHMTATIVVK